MSIFAKNFLMDNKSVRVRFAPSPTGPLHMGGVRTALYNYLFAKKHGGTFILRVEDTDQKRFVEGAEAYIVDALKWCGISPDESPELGGDFGPYVQSQRGDIYQPYAEKLLTSGHAYYAFDTSEDLENAREAAQKAGLPGWQYNHITRSSMKNSLSLSEDEVKQRLESGDSYVIRVKLPRNHEVRFHDEIRGWVVVNTNNLDDKVLFKSDGLPTYHMANIVDDHHMEISHVIRGEEWLPSAPLHVLLYEFLGWEAPKFAHLPLLLRPDGKGKLSKRDGDRLGFSVFPTKWHVPNSDETFSGYREDGYFPEAFINMLAMLGWNPGTNQEIFSLEELIQVFSLERVGKSGSKFDHDKAKWFNQQYLRSKNNSELVELIQPTLEKNSVSRETTFIANVCGLVKERATFVNDIWVEGQFFFEAPNSYDEKTVRKKWKDDTAQNMSDLATVLTSVDPFNAENIELKFKAFLEEKELGLGRVLPNFRLLVSGKGSGPSMFEICEVLGKEAVIERIHAGIGAVSALKASAE
jgi:glutamyl-tRNA synthetase